MKTLSKYSKILLGRNNNEPIYLNRLNDGKNQNMFDALKEHFGDTFILKNDSDIWTFCELVKTVYILKECAEVLGLGGSNYITNPCKDLIINIDEVTHINNVVLPQIFEEIYKLLKK